MSSVAVFSSFQAELPSFSGETFAARQARALETVSSSVRPASALEIRPAPEMMPFGIALLDALTGGVPRGGLTELVGPASSGRSSVMLSLMASVTRRQEVCALIDVTDSFDPASGEAAGVDLDRLLWVRCGKTVSSSEFPVSSTSTKSTAVRRPVSMREVAPPAKNISWSIHQNYDARLRHAITGGCYEMTKGREVSRKEVSSFEFQVSKSSGPVSLTRNSKPETRNFFKRNSSSKWTRLDQALKATDLLLQSGGFGLILIDLGDISIEQARRVPLTSWFRFRRVVENTQTILVLIARDSCAKTCASLVLQLGAQPLKSVSSFEFQGSSAKTDNRSTTRNLKPETGNSLTNVNLLNGLEVRVELVRTRLERKPVRSTGTLQTQTSWRRSG